MRAPSARDIETLPMDLRRMLAIVECEAVGVIAMLPPSEAETQQMVLALSAVAVHQARLGGRK